MGSVDTGEARLARLERQVGAVEQSYWRGRRRGEKGIDGGINCIMLFQKLDSIESLFSCVPAIELSRGGSWEGGYEQEGDGRWRSNSQQANHPTHLVPGGVSTVQASGDLLGWSRCPLAVRDERNNCGGKSAPGLH